MDILFTNKAPRQLFYFFVFAIIFILTPLFAHASNPTQITSCAQLELIGSGNPSYPASGSYILNGPSNVIDCSSINSGRGFIPIANFTGTLNGNNNTITGLYENDPSDSNIGLFADIESGAVVENFTITNSAIVGASTVGIVAGISNGGNIQNITVGTGTVSGVSNVGGLVGENGGIVSGSSASAIVSSTDQNAQNLGGLVGVDDGGGGGITNSYATGNVIAMGDNASNIGGLSGVENGGITNSYATGNVTGGLNSENVGGFIGDYAGGVVTNSYATGNVNAGQASIYVGGFTGNADGQSISTSYATGSVSGNSKVGGFAGFSDIPISDSYASGAVTIVGDGTGAGPQYVGGFVGTLASNVTDSYETGAVTISGSFTSAVNSVGGFAGQESASTTNTYAIGNVTVPAGSQAIGGYVGFIAGTATNSFSTGTVIAPQPGSNQIGGFAGENSYAILTNDSWYINSGGDGTYAEGNDEAFGLPNIPTLASLGYGTDQSTVSTFYMVTSPVYNLGGSGGWDFTTVWVPHLNGYPTLGISNSTFSITATAGTGGTVTPSGSTSVARDGSQVYSITPSSGYSLGTMTIDGVPQSATSTYTFSHVYTPHTIAATFISNTPSSTTPPILSNPTMGTYTDTSPISITYTLPQTPSSGSINLTFTPTTGTPIVLNLANVAAATPTTFTITPTQGFAGIAAIVSSSGGSTLPDGTYTVMLSYQDSAGDAAASTTVSGVTISAPIQSTNTNTSTTTSGGGISGGGCTFPYTWNSQTLTCQQAPVIVSPVTSASTVANTPTPASTASILGSGMCAPSLIITDNLKSGAKDGQYNSYNGKIVTQVNILQKQINRILAASYNQAAGPTDGIFGSLTKQGVQRLQIALNTILKPTPALKIDGIVGPFTKAAINNSCGGMK